MKIELNIFTNSDYYSPSTEIIKRTFQSFISTFGNVELIKIWHNPYPNIKHAKTYENNLKKIFNNVYITKSLSDGYIKSINESNSEFIFMLEHDWEFIKENINHTLDEILDEIQLHNIWHFRFNKRKNIIKNFDKKLYNGAFKNVPFCITSSISNNPHIINKDQYIKHAINKIKIHKNGGSKGIEERLSNIGLKGGIYGLIDDPPTIKHLDGRNAKKTKD